MNLGSLARKAREFARKNPGKVGQGIEKVGDQIDKRTGNKYRSQVDRAQGMAHHGVGSHPADEHAPHRGHAGDKVAGGGAPTQRPAAGGSHPDDEPAPQRGHAGDKGQA